MAYKDYAEMLCEATDIIVNEKIKSIQFDKTINCTIVDATEAAIGRYRVTDGSAYFYAFSTSVDYKKDDAVYVTVPNGDYNNQKIIIGKQVTKDTSPFIFKTPFDTIVDVSANVIDTKIESNNCWLRANDDETQELLLWSKNFKEAKQNIAGFTRLGIQGFFRSWLNNLNCTYGNYGYKIVLGCEEEVLNSDFEAYESAIRNITNDGYILNTSGIKWIEEDWNIFTSLSSLEEKEEFLKEKQKNLNYTEYTIYLSSQDMYGNPYNFESFYKQEKVFDISAIKQIIKIDLYFYQQENSFINSDGDLIPFKEKNSYLSPNLFTKNPYICFGYDIEDFNNDEAVLYCLDSSTYTDKATVENNKKHIILRWIHTFENGRTKTVSKDTDLEYEIRWYQYVLGSPSADEYSGVYWRRINNNEFYYDLSPSVEQEEEQIKVVILHNNTVIRSNIITFKHEHGVPNIATMEALAGLNIWCNDNTYGNYFVYDQGNKLLEQYNIKQARRMSALFSIESGLSNEEQNGSLLTEAESITWTFPTAKTMMTMNDINYSHSYEHTNGKKYIICKPKAAIRETIYENKDNELYSVTYQMQNGDIYLYNHQNETISITRYGKKAEGYAIDATQLYFIKETWSQQFGRNNIQCSIIKNNKTYYTSKTFYFGQAGTSGTDSTLVIYIDPSDAFAFDITEPTLNLRALLFNSQNQEVNLKNVANNNLIFEWNWYCYTLGSSAIPNIELVPTVLSDTGTKDNHNLVISNKILSGEELVDSPIYYNTTERNLITIQDPKNTANMDQLLIVQCTVKNWGDYPLTTYKAIPIKNGNTYSYADCASEVIYLTSGYPDYYKGSWSIYLSGVDENNDGYEDQDLSGTWEIFNPFNENPNYIAKFSKSNILQPVGIYMSNISPYGAQYKVNGKSVWTQPIVCLQNNYPSSTLNQWTGDSIEIDNDNGYILAPAIAAGKKNNDDNTFSGVMLGDWNYVDGQSKEITKQTGVYGFHHGAMSYAFKEDGTAFIGKSGKGRILFDGNESTIASEGYKKSLGGILIDLDDGYIDIKDSGNKTRVWASGGIVNNAAKPYFEIVGNNNTLMKISSTEYYLQSDNYGTSYSYWSGSNGIKLDIANGRLDAYSFYLHAQSSKGTVMLNSDAIGTITYEYPKYTWNTTTKTFDKEYIKTTFSEYTFSVEGSGTDGGIFAVDWSGNIIATSGHIGGFNLTKHSIYSDENGDSPFAGTGIYLGTATEKSTGKLINGKISFALGNKFRYNEAADKLFIASNIYRPTIVENDEGEEETKNFFLIGINNNNRLQIGSAFSANVKDSYSGVSIYGSGGAIYLIPNGSQIADKSVKITNSFFGVYFNNEDDVDGTKAAFSISKTALWVRDISASNQHGIYARFA